MKKLLLCAVLCILPSYVLAGNINNIRIKDADDTMGTNANEYHEIGGNQVFECDDDEGDVDNGVFLYYLSSNNIQISAKQCVLEWSGDYFQEVPISWCHNDGTYNCDKAQTIRMTESRSVCASGVVRKLDPVGFSNGSKIGCVFCNEGYVKSGSDCVPAQPAQPAPNNSVCYSWLGTTIDVGSAYVRKVTLQECRESDAHILDQNGLKFEMVCRAGPTLVCKATECPNGYTPNGDTGKCDPTDNNNGNNNNGGGGGGTGPNQCEQRRCAKLSGDVRNKCIACCHVLSDIAKWNSNTNTCICTQNASYLFVPNSDPKTGGFCLPQFGNTPPPTPEPEPDPEPAYECDSEIMAQLMTWQAQYASNATISAQIMIIIQYCEDDDPNENTFNVMYSQLVALINQENAAAQLTQQQNASRRRIEGAISDIESIVSTLDRSKWKNAEGGFNTSRLLSDSIAGVVLGTAGGLITSHVVKKNQVEGGFEDIQCTVGGQVVSGWGDEFQVGIQ